MSKQLQGIVPEDGQKKKMSVGKKPSKKEGRQDATFIALKVAKIGPFHGTLCARRPKRFMRVMCASDPATLTLSGAK